MNNFVLVKEEQKEMDLEKLKFKRPEVVDRSKQTQKAKTDAERIYEKYLPELAQKLNQLEEFKKDRESTWKASVINTHFAVILFRSSGATSLYW